MKVCSDLALRRFNSPDWFSHVRTEFTAITEIIKIPGRSFCHTFPEELRNKGEFTQQASDCSLAEAGKVLISSHSRPTSSERKYTAPGLSHNNPELTDR